MKAVFLALVLAICLPSEISGQSLYDLCVNNGVPSNSQYPYIYYPSAQLPYICNFFNPYGPPDSPYWYFTTPPSYLASKSTTKPTTSTTTTATTTTAGPPPCNYGNWTDCSLNGPAYQTRKAPPAQRYRCPTERRKCRVGAILGDLFLANFMAPSAPKAKSTGQQGQGNPQPGDSAPAGNSGGAGAGGGPSGTGGGGTGGGPSGTGGGGTGGGSSGIGGRGVGIGPGFPPPVYGRNHFFGGYPVPQVAGPRPPPVISRYLNLGSTPAATEPPNSGRFLNLGGPTTTPPTPTTQPPTPTPGCTQVYEAGNSGNLLLGNCNAGRYDLSAVGRKRRSTPLNEIRRDLLIMMDESASVGVFRFRKVKRLAVAIVKLLCDNIRYQHNYTRIAIMSFDKKVHLHVDLDKFYNSPNELADYITSHVIYNRYTHGKTCLGKALDSAYNSSLAKGGRRGQNKIEQDIIMITDGCANCATPQGMTVEDVIQEKSNFLADHGVHVYVIGIGLRAKCKNILKILAQGGRCYHFFYLNNWSYDVDPFIESLENPKDNLCLNIFERPGGKCLAQAND